MNESGPSNELLREQKESQEFPGIKKFNDNFDAIKQLSGWISYHNSDKIKERYVFSYKSNNENVDIGAISDNSGNRKLCIEKGIFDKNRNLVKRTKYHLQLTRNSNFILDTEEFDMASWVTISKDSRPMSEQQALSIVLPNFNKRILEANNYNTRQLIKQNDLSEAAENPDTMMDQALANPDLRT